VLKALAAKQARQEALPVAAVSLSDSIVEEEAQSLQLGQDFLWLLLGYNGLRKEGGGLYCEFSLQEVQDRELHLDSEWRVGKGHEHKRQSYYAALAALRRDGWCLIYLSL